MSGATSSARFNKDHLYDPNYTAEITARMQVPKCIKVGGNVGDEEEEFVAQIPWQYEKIDMRVPDRILVAGQDKHIGTSAPPRELILENTIMPPDPGMIRVHTPPRVIRLEDHYFPSAGDDYGKEPEHREEILAYKENNMNTSQTSLMDQSMNASNVWNNGPFLKTEEEVVHLRKQLVKMNRRVLSIERELLSKQQRDKIIIGMTTAYFIIKIFMWISKTN